jgi:SAM-dependent methyltransferase
MNIFLHQLVPPIAISVIRKFASLRVPSRRRTEQGMERPSHWYDEAYRGAACYEAHYADSPYYPFWCVVADRISLLNPRCILDVGCGPGQFAAFLRARGIDRYVGLDFSTVSVGMAKAACEAFDFRCEDAFKTELFHTLDYDIVVACEFLEHVEGDIEILDRIRPGTRMFGSVPSFAHPGHVRCFGSCNDVVDRYGSRFSEFRVDEFPFGGRGLSLFVFEGIKLKREDI